MGAPEFPDLSPESFRTYLRLIVGSTPIKRLAAKIDGSDIVQETMLRAELKKDQFIGNSEEQYRAWLLRIMSNLIAETVRRYETGKRDANLEQSIQGVHDTALRLESLVADLCPSPSANAMRNETVDRLSAALDRLSDVQREAILLRYMNGLSVNEVADALKKTRAGVAGLLRRGLDSLRTQLS